MFFFLLIYIIILLLWQFPKERHLKAEEICEIDKIVGYNYQHYLFVKNVKVQQNPILLVKAVDFIMEDFYQFKRSFMVSDGKNNHNPRVKRKFTTNEHKE